MNPLDFLELFASLSLQVFVVVLATYFLSRLTSSERLQCKLWQMCYWVLLTLVFVAVTLPHIRWTPARLDIERRTLATIAEWEMDFGRVVFSVWFVGALFALGLGMIRWLRVRLFLATCKELDTTSNRHIRESLKLDDGNDSLAEIRFLTSDTVGGPFCTQFHRPFIVLPTYLLDFEQQELVQIIRHEMEHIRTGHPLQLFIQRIVELLFWFHPTVWWASHQYELSREFVCDHAAVNSTDGIVCYLRTLLKVVEHAVTSGPSQPLSFGNGKGSIARRAERLVDCVQNPIPLKRSRRRESAIVLLFVAASIVAPLLWLPINVLASPRSRLSPWPRFTARVLHDCGVPVRDYELYHHDNQLHELREINDGAPRSPSAADSAMQ